MSAKKRGRPNMPEGESMSELLSIRLTAEEHAAIQSLAKQGGMTISQLVRSVLLKPEFTIWQFRNIHVEIRGKLTLKNWEALRGFVDVIKPE